MVLHSLAPSARGWGEMSPANKFSQTQARSHSTPFGCDVRCRHKKGSGSLSKRWFKAEGFAIAGMLVVGTPAHADQATQAASQLGLDEVTVTARRVVENVQTVPIAVSVVSAERVESLAINTPLDLNKIAGLGGAPIGSRTAVNFSLRGHATAYGVQPGVIPYFAELPGFPLAYFDLQNVQVIKGPQGTLFAQTSTGGVVLFEPRRPTDHFEDYVDLEGAIAPTTNWKAP
jgi:outer membrane receptor protein involved in Fe transport